MALDLVQPIKRQLYLSMNGEVSSAMQERGIAYRLNYGLNLPQIRQIASLYSPSKELASALWKEKIRETMILALLLAPVADYSQEEFILWGKEFPTFELSTLGAFYLFCHREDACHIAAAWLKDATREETVDLALHTLAGVVKNRPDKGEDVYNILLSFIEVPTGWTHSCIGQGVFLVLRLTGKAREDLQPRLLLLADRCKGLSPAQEWKELLNEEWYFSSLTDLEV